MLQQTLDRKEAEPLEINWSGPAQKYVDELEEEIRRYHEMAKASAKVTDRIGVIEDNPYMPRGLGGGPRLPFR